MLPPLQIRDYTIVTNSKLATFVQNCRELIQGNWVPIGGVTSIIKKEWDEYGKLDYEHIVYTQAFIKYGL